MRSMELFLGESLGDLTERYPGHLRHLDVGVGQFSAVREHQVVSDGLVDPLPCSDEPEVDRAETTEDDPVNTGLLLDFPDGRLFFRLTRLDMAFGQRPQQPAAPVQPTDQRALGVSSPTVQHQSPGGELLHPAQRPTAGRRGRHGPIVRGEPVLRRQ